MDTWLTSATVYLQIDTLREQLRIAKDKLQKSEAQYRRRAVEGLGMDEQIVDAMIIKARSSPQKNAHLRQIYEDYKAVHSKEEEIRARN